MARPRHSIIEYRSYEYPGNLPVQIHNRMNWEISSVKSSRLHIHNCFEIGLCLSGSGGMNFGEQEVSFRGGDILFVARNVPHTTWSDPATGSVWKYIHMDPERLLRDAAAAPGNFIRMFSDCRLILPSADYPWAKTLTELILSEADRGAPGFEEIIRGACEALFFSLFRVYSEEEKQPGDTRLMSSELSPALEYVNHHYMENFPQEKLAGICHISPTHFRRLFQQQLGTNPLSYLHQVRIMKSCDLLRSTNLSVAGIAEEVGYQSLSCFNRHFAEYNQCTPSEWRNLRHDARRTTTVGLAGWDRPETAVEIRSRNLRDGQGDESGGRLS